MPRDKIITPVKTIKKDQTIITPEMQEKCPTTTILEKPIKMDVTSNRTHLAFGVSEIRMVEILHKLIAVAKVYPRYSVIAESFVNCSDRFTVMERLFGIFLLGKVKGQHTVLKQLKIQVKSNSVSATLEQKLLSLLCKNFIIEDPLLKSLLERP